ncbi:MAG: hypothetical protein FJ368_00365 [Pelagibacterales bacterium]|nr:hypothetical protein [Pelagibacterales bacterium]
MLGQRSISKILVLHIIAALFVIINVSDVEISGFSDVIPLFDLMLVFYFAVFKNVFSLWFIFLMGIWGDALNGDLLGVTPFCYLILVRFFASLNHRLIIRENFQQIIQQFAFFCFLFLLMKWLILSILHGTLYSIGNAAVQMVLSSVFYVVMHKFFDYLSEKLLGSN